MPTAQFGRARNAVGVEVERVDGCAEAPRGKAEEPATARDVQERAAPRLGSRSIRESDSSARRIRVSSIIRRNRCQFLPKANRSPRATSSLAVRTEAEARMAGGWARSSVISDRLRCHPRATRPDQKWAIHCHSSTVEVHPSGSTWALRCTVRAKSATPIDLRLWPWLSFADGRARGPAPGAPSHDVGGDMLPPRGLPHGGDAAVRRRQPSRPGLKCSRPGAPPPRRPHQLCDHGWSPGPRQNHVVGQRRIAPDPGGRNRRLIADGFANHTRFYPPTWIFFLQLIRLTPRQARRHYEQKERSMSFRLKAVFALALLSTFGPVPAALAQSGSPEETLRRCQEWSDAEARTLARQSLRRVPTSPESGDLRDPQSRAESAREESGSAVCHDPAALQAALAHSVRRTCERRAAGVLRCRCARWPILPPALAPVRAAGAGHAPRLLARIRDQSGGRQPRRRPRSRDRARRWHRRHGRCALRQLPVQPAGIRSGAPVDRSRGRGDR